MRLVHGQAAYPARSDRPLPAEPSQARTGLLALYPQGAPASAGSVPVQQETLRRRQAASETLRWQMRYRVAVALVVGVLAMALRAVGVPEGSSLVFGSVRDAAIATAIITAGYLLVQWAIARRLRATRRAGVATLSLVVALDLALVFGFFVVAVPPVRYGRALLFAMVILHATVTYFGRFIAHATLLMTLVFYLAVEAVAHAHGSPAAWGEAWFTTVVYAVLALTMIAVQGNLSSRMTRLVELFERVEEGDFSQEYDVAADRRPDALTVVGRAYNRMRSQLISLVITDSLSGCVNRRGFEVELRRELARAARAAHPVSLIAVDVDHFKQINDRYGHLVGDQVIAEIGRLLREATRGSDLVARMGGEEFMFLLPETDADGALQLAERVAERVRAHRFPGVPASHRVTASFGVAAEIVRDVDVAEDLRGRADEALYAAKREGRDRAVLWTPHVHRRSNPVVRVSGTMTGEWARM